MGIIAKWRWPKKKVSKCNDKIGQSIQPGDGKGKTTGETNSKTNFMPLSRWVWEIRIQGERQKKVAE